MSVTVNVDDLKNYKNNVQSYATDKTYIGIIITAVIAIVILIVAFFMNIVKWLLIIVAIILFITVGVRLYTRVKEYKNNNK
jgi:Flp pilus assembly protein TadB